MLIWTLSQSNKPLKDLQNTYLSSSEKKNAKIKESQLVTMVDIFHKDSLICQQLSLDTTTSEFFFMTKSFVLQWFHTES